MSSKKDRIQGLLNRTDHVEASSAAKHDLLFAVNTEIHKTVDTEIQDFTESTVDPIKKKKATFELDAQLHTRLKIFAAASGKKMVDVVEEAVQQYLDRHQ